MRIEKMATKSDVIVKLVLVFFVTLLSFSVGTFVGKKYSDNQHQLAQLEPGGEGHGANREVASEHESHDSKEGTKVGAMSDEEIAKLAEEFVTDEKESPAKEVADHGEEGHGEKSAEKVADKHDSHAEKAAEKPSAKHVAAAKEETIKVEASHVAQQLAAGQKPDSAPVKKPIATNTERVPSSLPKNVAQYTVGKFTVQVASFADEGEAQKTASELKEKGYSAFYIPANVSGKTWFRVSVGQFATQKEAQSYRAELLTKEKVSTAIVQKITE